MDPFFSIIVPMYNREAFVGRALRSCLNQGFESFELVVVDDASADRSIDVVREFTDPRIRLLKHEYNRGQGPARNTGMAAACGSWFVFLDSDDELTPGALEAMHRRAMAADPQVGGLRFMCADETGTSPVPPHHDEILDYEGYVRSLDPMLASGKQETLPCVRRSTFPRVSYSDSHVNERWYHLELARTVKVQTCSDVARRYHHDAADRLTIPRAERSLRYAKEDAADVRQVLSVHGQALQKWAPEAYVMTLAGATTASFLAGHRIQGLRYTVRSWRLMPLSPRVYVVALLGLLGRTALARAQARRAQTLDVAQVTT